jgi:hypothetical protein
LTGQKVCYMLQEKDGGIMMTPDNTRIMKVKCWNCGETFAVEVSPDSEILLPKDSGKVKKFPRTVRLECASEICRKDKDNKKAPINMVDNFVGTMLKGLGTEVQAKVISTNVQSFETNGRMPTTDEEDWIKLNTEQRRSSLTLLNDAAKLLFAFPTTITTLYLGLIGGISATAAKALNLWSVAPVFAWVLGGGFAMFTIFPWIGRVDPDSPTNIWSNHNRAVTRKFWLLVASLILFAIGMGLAGWRIVNLINLPKS